MTSISINQTAAIRPSKVRPGMQHLFLLALTLCIAGTSLLLGDHFPNSFSELMKLTTGQAGQYQNIVVWQWRAPRIFCALVIGASLALSGAIFQSLVRNPLGSPDVTGFNVGAFTGVLLTIAIFGNWFWITVAGSLAGGLIAAVLVYLFAYRDGYSGFRLIIVGIGISATLTAFNQWLSLTVSLETAMTAAIWGAGSLNGLTWSKTIPVSILLVMMIVALSSLNSRMRILEMGDAAASALGVPINRVRIILMLVGVGLTAVTTAATGPIAFIALAAPQIAKRIDHRGEVSLFTVALVGALLMITADFISQHAWSQANLPVGLVTLSLGGVYLLYLIIRQGKLS